MPKLKTHRGTAKRTRLTKTGKLLHRRPYGNHHLGKKNSARKRGYAKNYELTGQNKKNLETRLGNNK